jgi:hypothetical protein
VTIAECFENAGGAPTAVNVGLHNRKLDLPLGFADTAEIHGFIKFGLA